MAEDEQSETVSEADESTETAEDTDGDGAGFGIVVGLLALVAAALLSVRRRNSRE
ncbi:PGF-CTERM sorting domain-containing protein [Halovenus salina]|uniref:PGF-CTERM sorting domain-containing protein n=1 Tax=Halovenus salina TaxID=1510225 RepID=A0ABD5W5F3_9EURY|nr:PGF-CTERM sorting domain-containing protein [Halovenus salina]